MPAVKKASIIDVPLHIFPIDIYLQLTHLTVDYWYRNYSRFHEEARTLPLLTYFAIYGQLGYIHTFRAPNLVTLIIRDIKDYSVNYDVATKSEDRSITDIFPEILHIGSLSHIMTSDQVLDLMCQIGRNVKELYITFTSIIISKEVTDNLIGRLPAKGVGKDVQSSSQDRVLMCPLLQRLEVLTPRPDYPSDRRLTRKNLQRVVNSRSSIAAGGSLPLQRVRYGVYPPVNPFKHPNEVRYATSRKWWMIEWEELLWL
jgi:hypothetical protein